MKPADYDFGTIQRGDTTSAYGMTVAVGGVPYDFGVAPSARIQAREKKTDNLIVEWSTDSGTISLATGVILIGELPPSITRTLQPGTYVAELELTVNGRVQSWLRGPLKIEGDIAHD